jgi:pyridinium-3,5-biscarboxylic acid mononucleotide sulfurtransferase
MANTELAAKSAALHEILRSLGRTLIAYSGGVDSGFLAWAAHEALGAEMLAVIADSPSLARSQLADAVAFAHEQGIPLEILSTDELDRPEYVRNDGSRCFHCKDELFAVMEELGRKHGFQSIAYGINFDDQGDFRPGQAAANRHGIQAPLLAAGLAKQEIRELARQAGLRIWDKPAAACLSSRIEYGRPVTREALRRVKKRSTPSASASYASATMERLYASRLPAMSCHALSQLKWPPNSRGFSKPWASSLSPSIWKASAPAP